MIRLERGDVLEVVLARPERRNALTPQMLDELASIDPAACRARAVLVRGEGKAFCSGFDLDFCLGEPEGTATLLRGLARAIASMRRWPMPVVVCVHGAAVAGGCALLTGADVVIAAAGTKLGYPVTRIGVSPAVNAPLLRLAVGDGPVRGLLLRPNLIVAAEALELGLVHEVAGDGEAALARARAVGGSWANAPQRGLRATRAWLAEIESGLGPAGAATRGLEASLELAGGEEERARLASAVGRRRA